MKRIALIAALAALALAQGSSPAPVGSVFLVLPDGTQALVHLVGFNLTHDAQGYTLQPALPPAAVPPVVVTGERPAPLTPGSPLNFQLAQMPAAGTLRLFRNGLRQSPGVDYTLQGQMILFVEHYAEDTSPVIVADYVVAQ